MTDETDVTPVRRGWLYLPNGLFGSEEQKADLEREFSEAMTEPLDPDWKPCCAVLHHWPPGWRCDEPPQARVVEGHVMKFAQVGEERGLRVERMCEWRVQLRLIGWHWLRRAPQGLVADVIGVGIFWGTSPVYGWIEDESCSVVQP